MSPPIHQTHSKKGNKKQAENAQLAIPQHCSEKQLATRKKALKESRSEYAFDHSWRGYPPSIKHMPWKEMPPKAIIKLIESGFKLETAKIEEWARRVLDELEHIGGTPEPFHEYSVIFGKKKLPPIAKKHRWKLDAVFAAQRLYGMYPWFIRRVEDLAALQKRFPIADEMIAGLLPRGATLQELQQANRLYYVEHPELEGAKPAHGHVMTAPTTLFYVTNLGQLLPIGIQLHPQTSDTNPIFTPNDPPHLWLAIKIHAACADVLVHSVYSHAILMHFVMCNVWTALNRTLPETHPVHAFLKPHFWSTLFVTKAVKSSMDTKDGSQTRVYGTGLPGQNKMVKRLYADFDFSNYNPRIDFARRGVDDKEALPGFYYRDDALALWDADLAYVKNMMDLFYETDDDVRNDTELQAWMQEMQDKKGAGIVGLPVNPQGEMETREQLHLMLTSVLFTVTSRHSSIENGALEYSYPPANPFLFKLKPPANKHKKMSLSDVASKLPSVKEAIAGYSLIATADFDPNDFGLLGKYDDDFMAGGPGSVKKVVKEWRAALKRIAAEIDARNEKLETPYTAMKPTRTYNSIWN